MGADVPGSKELQKKAIQYRLDTTKIGSVKLHVIDEIDPTQRAEFIYDMAFDNDKIRQVRRGRIIGALDWGPSQTTIVTRDSLVWEPGPDEPVQARGAKDYTDARQTLGVLDPRALGMVLGGTALMNVQSLEMLLNPAGQPDIEVSPDIIAGTKTWKLAYGVKGEREVRVWIAPDQSFGVVRAEYVVVMAGQQFVQSIESEFQQYEGGGVWYPKRVIAEDKLGGKVTTRQIVIVEKARFAEEIDGNIFTLASLGLKPGRDVLDTRSGRAIGAVWNGTDVVAPRNNPFADPPIQPQGNAWIRWVGYSIGFLLIAGALVSFRLRTKRKNSV